LLLPLDALSGQGRLALPDGTLPPDAAPGLNEIWPVDERGRSFRSETFVVEVGSSGAFHALIEIGPDQPLLARLWGSGLAETGPASALLAETATPAADDARGLFSAPDGRPGRSSLSAVTDQGPWPGYLEIKAEGLNPGFYTLALSRFHLGTRAVVYLSEQNQAGEAFPTVEEILAPPRPEGGLREIGFLYAPVEPPEAETHKLSGHHAVRVKFETRPERRYRTFVRPGGSDILFPLGLPVGGTGETAIRNFPLSGLEEEFRVLEMPGNTDVPFEIAAAIELRVARTKPGWVYRLSSAAKLEDLNGSVATVGEAIGTGGAHSWFVEAPSGQHSFYFLEVEEGDQGRGGK
jgi:hypothetical protein